MNSTGMIYVKQNSVAIQNKINLGAGADLDLNRLVTTRMLVQANSGGGKSWLIRRLLEQTHGKIQHVVIDLEGEFTTLREKFDYILAGQDGDIPAEPRSAALLARKLMELRVSAILDLSELKKHERKLFVKNFLEALIDCPKDLWHDCLVVVDEAHQFCPQHDKSESTDAVINLMTLGRKRHFCGILATQRLSKLHKDAVAECNNKMIGRTGLDVDMKRASDELGFATKEQMRDLRNLKAGEFYAFGPALSESIEKVKIGAVRTTHTQAGNIDAKVPVARTRAIQEVLKKLTDLPEEARKEARTIGELQAEIRTLRAHRCPKGSSREDIEKSVAAATGRLEQVYDRKIKDLAKQAERSFLIDRENLRKRLIEITKEELDSFTYNFNPGEKVQVEPSKMPLPSGVRIGEKVTIGVIPRQVVPPEAGFIIEEDPQIKPGARRMIEVLAARHPMKMSKAQLATFTGMKKSGGSFRTYLSAIRMAGFIIEENGLISASEEGIEFAGVEPQAPQSPEETLAMWRAKLKPGAVRMLDALVEQYPNPVQKDELAQLIGMELQGGSFRTYLSMLKTNSLINVSAEGIVISDNIYS